MRTKLLLTFAGILACISGSFAQVFFSEDFEGTMNAATDLPTGWTETGFSTDGIWSTGDAATASSAYLTWPTPSVGTNFAYTNDDNCNCDKSADRMILPAQDLTGMTTITMTLDGFLNGGYGESMTCEVSTDGGTTWTNVYSFVGSANFWQNGITISLSAYAGMSNVLISFLYNDAGSWAFAGGVDNITIAETSSVTDLDVLSHNGEYTIIPEAQAVAMTLSANVYNNSAVSLTDVVLDANVYLNGSLDATVNGTATSIAAGDTVNVIAGMYTPSAPGNYSVEYFVSTGTFTDSDSTNDTIYYNFTIDPATYARDNGIAAINLGVNGTGNTAVIGSNFQINTAARMDSLLSFHGALTAGDTLVYQVFNTSGGVPSTMIGQSEFYIVTAADETAGFVIPMVAMYDLGMNDLMLSTGTYFVGYNEFTSINNGALACSDSIFTPNTVFGQINGGAWQTLESLGFSNTPIIRPHFANCANFMASTTSTDVLCNGDTNGTATVSANGTPGYTYQWDANAGNQTTATATGLGTGTYYVTITDTAGCSATDSVTINEPVALSASTVDNGDGTATASANGGTPGYTYQWDANANNQTTATATGLVTGSYTVTVTDTNGCSTTSTVSVVYDAGIEELNAFGVTMQPNPASGMVYITAENVQDLSDLNIRIYSASGQLVLDLGNAEVAGGQIEINISGLASGVYTVTFESNEKSAVARLAITK